MKTIKNKKYILLVIAILCIGGVCVFISDTIAEHAPQYFSQKILSLPQLKGIDKNKEVCLESKIKIF